MKIRKIADTSFKINQQVKKKLKSNYQKKRESKCIFLSRLIFSTKLQLYGKTFHSECSRLEKVLLGIHFFRRPCMSWFKAEFDNFFILMVQTNNENDNYLKIK